MKKLFNILFGRKPQPNEGEGKTVNLEESLNDRIVSNNGDIEVGIWCKIYSSNLHIHPDDREIWRNYPYLNHYHCCLWIENGYYSLRFSGLIIRVLRNGLIKLTEPEFYPFEQINYLTTKEKLEFGRIIGYTGYYKPKPERAYTILVKGKVKSNRYRKDRLSKSSIPYNRIEFNKKLSKLLSYSLRHNPDEFGIELDNNGWTNLNDLIESISAKEEYFIGLSFYDISLMIDHSEKKRHELEVVKKEHEKKWLGTSYEWKIRAKYGHSINNKVNYGISEPPTILYHGTDSQVLNSIMKYGLDPMARQYVHLTTDRKTAKEVGLRKSQDMIVLEVMAKEAYKEGQKFYKVDQNIWLTDKLKSRFVTKEHDH
jgi:putative RNA 2'-phosphotransferase